ncbi:MAG: hypothetical protein ISP86_05960, partial [Shewanellaceae bacterium]|nr:hypothetical protein [Shewanellaceae bacterium]
MNARLLRCFFLNTLVGITFFGCTMPLLAQTCARPEPVSELDDAPLTARYTAENVFDDIDKAGVLPHVSASDIALTTEESGAFMHYLGRYGAYLGRGLAAVTPVFDAMMLADWTTQIIHTVQDPKHDVYDDWAAALYLIPGVAGVAELAAQRHHLHQALATKLHDLNAAKAYPVTDNSRQANVYRVQIEAGFNMLTQMRQDHQFEQQWAWLQLTQGAYQNWHQHLQTWVEQQMTQLTEPYEAHLYAQLYRAPYGLGQQLALREYPAACDARLLQVNINPSLYPAIRRQLHTCLDTINRNLLHPILDVIQGEHPHVNLQTWSTLAQQHRTGFNAIAMAANQAERTWWQRWPQQSRQRLSLQGWAQHWHASLTPVVNRLKNLILRHWLANTFADVPLHHISIDVEQHTVALLDEQWCSPQFHQSRWYRIKGMATTCRIMDQVTSWFAPADVIQFDPQKSRLWQQLERLMTAPPLQIDMNM